MTAFRIADVRAVIEDYAPMREALGDSYFMEAKDAEGMAWDAVIIRAGLSKNGTYYSDAVLREAAPLFEGIRVFAKADAEHLRGEGKDPNKLAGWFSGTRFIEGTQPDAGYIGGRFNFAAGARALRETVTDAWKRGKRDLIGFSIDALGRVSKALRAGARQVAAAITRVQSVDLIVEPSAGGALVRLVEAAAAMTNDTTNKLMLEEDRLTKIGDMLDAFFDPQHKDHRSTQSFKECYIEITGDQRVTGRIEDVDRARLAGSVGAAFLESLDSTSWANVLGASITRRMIAEYRRDSRYSVWRNLVTIARDVTNFRTQDRVRYGGYGDLPIVNQGAAYLAFPSPVDEKATYSVSKRGGTETITLEMVRNDDVQAIRRIPKRLADAAQRTLAHFVLDFLRTNPVIYDGIALFHASHGNLGNAALSAGGLAAAQTAMKRQTELGSGDPLGLVPRFLWFPVDLEETAVNLFQRGTNQDKTFVQNLNVDVIPVWYWTDVNDWCVSADPAGCPTIEIAFLDGQEDPELFVQDMPNVGSMFSNDQITFKIRHIYGGAVLEYRGIYKSVV
jgi:hypothetical protein